MKNQKRKIESFELTSEYYIESFICGNKMHVASELKLLKDNYLNIFLELFIELPKDIQSFVLNRINN